MRGDDKFITLRNGGGGGLSRFTGGVPPEGLKKLNAMVDVLNRLDNSLISLNPQEVIRLVPRPRPQTNCLPFKNLSDYAIPQGGVILLQSPMQSDGETYSGYQPTGPYMQQLAVADGVTPPNKSGVAWRDGIVRAIVSPSDWTAFAALRFPVMGNSQTNSFEICRHFGDGPIIIWALDAVSPFVRAEFVR